jgi:hypothetical protein
MSDIGHGFTRIYTENDAFRHGFARIDTDKELFRHGFALINADRTRNDAIE